MFLRLLIIFIIVAVAGAVFYSVNRSEGGAAPLFRGLAEVRSLTKQAEPEPSTKTTVYKWQDKHGEWHFSNQAPPEGAAAKVITYRSDINIISAPKSGDATPPENPATSPAADPGKLPLLPLADPGRVKQLIDDAKNVQKLMDGRQQQIDQTVESGSR